MSEDGDFRGFYINLDRSRHRRERLERHFAALGLASNYERFPAIDGRAVRAPPNFPVRLHPGAVGCFLSHVSVLERAQALHTLVHIAEDDIVLSRYVAPFLRMLPSQRIFEHFDILFLDMWVDPGHQPLGALRTAYDLTRPDPGAEFDLSRIAVVDMRHMRLGGTSSYVVSPSALPWVLSELRRALPVPQKPLDAYLAELVRNGTLRAAVTIPFLTTIDTVDGSRSLIQNAVDEDYMLLVALLRNFLFVDRDVDGQILPELRALAAKRPERLYLGAVKAIESFQTPQGGHGAPRRPKPTESGPQDR
jgi:GR25 family glycosyltransferase involved in LPS biosynthesis